MKLSQNNSSIGGSLIPIPFCINFPFSLYFIFYLYRVPLPNWSCLLASGLSPRIFLFSLYLLLVLIPFPPLPSSALTKQNDQSDKAEFLFQTALLCLYPNAQADLVSLPSSLSSLSPSPSHTYIFSSFSLSPPLLFFFSVCVSRSTDVDYQPRACRRKERAFSSRKPWGS